MRLKIVIDDIKKNDAEYEHLDFTDIDNQQVAIQIKESNYAYIKLTNDGLMTLQENNGVYELCLEWESSGEQEILETFTDKKSATRGWLNAILYPSNI
jgi:hypothetical protein